jgi:hypothetical protein
MKYEIQGFQLVKNEWVALDGAYSLNPEGDWVNKENAKLPDPVSSFIIQTEQGSTFYFQQMRLEGKPTYWLQARLGEGDRIFWYYTRPDGNLYMHGKLTDEQKAVLNDATALAIDKLKNVPDRVKTEKTQTSNTFTPNFAMMVDNTFYHSIIDATASELLEKPDELTEPEWKQTIRVLLTNGKDVESLSIKQKNALESMATQIHPFLLVRYKLYELDGNYNELIELPITHLHQYLCYQLCKILGENIEYEKIKLPAALDNIHIGEETKLYTALSLQKEDPYQEAYLAMQFLVHQCHVWLRTRNQWGLGYNLDRDLDNVVKNIESESFNLSKLDIILQICADNGSETKSFLMDEICSVYRSHLENAIDIHASNIVYGWANLRPETQKQTFDKLCGIFNSKIKQIAAYKITKIKELKLEYLLPSRPTQYNVSDDIEDSFLASLNKDELYQLYKIPGFCNYQKILNTKDLFTTDEIKCIFNYRAVQDSIKIIRINETELNLSMDEFIFIYQHLPESPSSVRAETMAAITHTQEHLDFMIKSLDEKEHVTFLLKTLEYKSGIEGLILSMLPKDLINKNFPFNEQVQEQTEHWQTPSVIILITSIDDEIKKIQVAASFMAHESRTIEDIISILEIMPPEKLIDRMFEQTDFKNKIDLLTSESHEGYVNTYRKLYRLCEHQSPLSINEMKEAIESSLELTFEHLMSRFSDKAYVEDYVFSETFTNAIEAHLQLNPKNIKDKYYTLADFEIFLQQENIQKLYDHILNTINTDSAKSHFRFLIMHMKDKKPTNWLDIFLASHPTVLTDLMGKDIYKDINPKNHQDALLITYLLCEKYGIPTGEMFKTRIFIVEDFKRSGIPHAFPEAICTITDIKTGVTTDCLVENSDGMIIPIKQYDKNISLSRHREDILSLTCNIHLLKKIKENGYNLPPEKMALSQKMYSCSNEAFVSEYVKSNNISETLDLIFNIGSAHSISLKLIYEIEKLIKTDARASKLISAELIKKIQSATDNSENESIEKSPERQQLNFHIQILTRFLEAFQNQDQDYLVTSLCIHYHKLITEESAGIIASIYVNKFMKDLLKINNYDLNLIFLNATCNMPAAHVKDMLSPQWAKILINQYKSSHKPLLSILVSTHRTLFAKVDLEFTFLLLEQDRKNQATAAFLKSLEAQNLPSRNFSDEFLRDNICTNIKNGNELGEILRIFSSDKWAVILKTLKITPHSDNDNIDFSWLGANISSTLPSKFAAYELYKGAGRKALTSFMNAIGQSGGYSELFDALHQIDAKLKVCTNAAQREVLFNDVRNAIITHFEKEFELRKADEHNYSPSASTKAIANK